MTVEFTTNAQARMLERGVREDEVLSTLEAPDHLGPCLEKRWQAKKRIGGRVLEVVFARDLLQTTILTAFWQESSG